MRAVGGAMILADGTRLPLARAICANGFIFVSGQLGLTGEGKLEPGDVAAQTRRALANIETILAAAGATLGDIVKTTVWLTDGADFAAFNTAYAASFPDQAPARSTVVSGLLIPGARVEIDVIAVDRTAPG